MDIFYEKLDAHIQRLNEKFRAKFVITKEMHDDIILVLRDGWGDAQLKYWVNKKFALAKLEIPMWFTTKPKSAVLLLCVNSNDSGIAGN
jgi:hypothetical protein